MKAKRCQRDQRKRPQKPRRTSLLFVLFAVSLLIIAGCGDGTTPSSTPAVKKDLSVGKKVEGPAKVAETKEAEKKEEERYTYNPTGKPDPFKSFIQFTPLRSSSRKVPLTPLERYEITQLKLVAVISAPEGNIGLVEDSAGKGYFLKKGTWIGKNEGKVKTILKDRVVIEEVFQDILGQTKANEISLLLHQPEEEGGS